MMESSLSSPLSDPFQNTCCSCAYVCSDSCGPGANKDSQRDYINRIVEIPISLVM